MNEFRFKRFSVSHDGPAMKVGTDGVLLGAWCSVAEGMRRALDIGTGTGLIALMLAQRGEEWGMEADAVEVDGAVARQAARNFAASPWSERIKVFNCPVQQLAGVGDDADGRQGADGEGGIAPDGRQCVEVSAGNAPEGDMPERAMAQEGVFHAPAIDRRRYDLIASNPPYFEESLLPPDESRSRARHTTELSFPALASSAAALLAPTGRFAVVIPYVSAGALIRACGGNGLTLVRRTDVSTVCGAAPKRTLLEFAHTAEGLPDMQADVLVVENPGRGYTPEYVALTRDFYLKF